MSREQHDLSAAGHGDGVSTENQIGDCDIGFSTGQGSCGFEGDCREQQSGARHRKDSRLLLPLAFPDPCEALDYHAREEEKSQPGFPEGTD